MSDSLRASEQVQLRERVKELKCLYRVAALSQRRDCDVLEYLRVLPDLLPPGWYYPEISAARVRYRGQTYVTENFQETPWKLVSPLKVGGRDIGALELVYLEEKPPRDEGPFLTEERELLNALATHVAEALQNKELEVRLRRAQRLEALGFLAGAVAHDFNNYLGVIGLVAEQALAKDGHGESMQGDLKEILRVVERSCRLTNRLVGFASTGEGQTVPLCLNATLTESRSLLSRLLSSKVQLKLELEPDLSRVSLDPTQWDQLLANLAVNARDAMPDGGVFEIATLSLPEDRVMMSCSDTGCGMSQDTLERLFEPFYSTKTYGAGLGMATVEDVVHRAGGEIRVRSVLGEGTCFEVTFPALADDQPPQPAPVGGTPAQATILLVDDEPALRYMCERTLGTFGYRVLSAETAEEALLIEEAEKGQINLLLTDLTLADMNGRLLAERLRASRPDISVLLMSGYNLDSIADLVEGFPFLQKPFNRASLQARLTEVLAAQGS